MTSARRKARQTYVGAPGVRVRGSIYTGLPGVPLYFTKGQAGPALSRKQPVGQQRKRMMVPHQSRKGVWSLRWARVAVQKAPE